MGKMCGISFKLLLMEIILLGIITVGLGDEDAPNDPIQKINILLIYEDPWTAELFNIAIKYVEGNREELRVEIGTVHRFHSNNASYPLTLVTNFCTQLDRFMQSKNPPDIAIDFTKTGPNSEAVKVVLRSVQMPTIAGTFGQESQIREWRNLSEAEKNYFIQVSPPVDMLVHSVRSFVAAHAMKSAVVLYDEKYTMDHKRKTLLQDLPTLQFLAPLDFTNLTGQISTLTQSDISNFFIASTPSAISEILARASSPDATGGSYFSDEFAWYSMSMEDELPRCTGCESPMSLIHLSPLPLKMTDQKAFLQAQLNGFPTYTQIFYFDITLAAIKAVRKLKEDHKWAHDITENSCVKWHPRNNFRYPEIQLDLFEAFQKVTKENILKYHLEKNGRNYPEFRMKIQRLTFEAMSGTPKLLQNIGIWNSGVGNQELINLEGETGKQALAEHKAIIVQRVVVFVHEPFIIKIENCTEKHKYDVCFIGYCMDMLQQFAERLNFNYTVREVDSGYGYSSGMPPNEEWNGMVRELMDRKADIALGGMSMMTGRENVIDFTEPFYDELVGFQFVMKKKIIKPILFKFLTILEPKMWWFMLGCYFFSCVSIWVCDRWSPLSYQNNMEKYVDYDEKRIFSFKECLWFCANCMFTQGGGVTPIMWSGRIAACTWMGFSFFSVCSFTANMAACFTLQRMANEKIIETYDQLIYQSDVKFAPVVNSSLWFYYDQMAHAEYRLYHAWKYYSIQPNMSVQNRSRLAVWDYPISDKYTDLWQTMMEANPPTTRDEAIDRVLKRNGNRGEYALIDESTTLKWLAHRSCDFDIRGKEFSRRPYAVGVQKNSPLKDKLTQTILDLKYERYFEVIKEKWWNWEKKWCPIEKFDREGLSIENAGGAFIVFAVGIILSILTLAFEFWYYRKRDTVVIEIEVPAKDFVTTEEKRMFMSFFVSS